MSRGLAITFAIGLLLIGAAVWSVFHAQAGAHLVPQGSILKVRTQKIDDTNSLMVIDFRLTNNAGFPMVIRKADVTVETRGGETISAQAISGADANKVFTYYPLLGQRFNDVMILRDKVPPHQTIDRMMAFQLSLPWTDLESRKKVTMQIEDVTGPVAEFTSR